MSDKAITWGKIKVYDIQDSDLDTAEDMEFPFHPGSRFYRAVSGSAVSDADHVLRE